MLPEGRFSLEAQALLSRLLSLAEAGKMISAANLAAIKAAADALSALIAKAEGDANAPSDEDAKKATEAARLLLEADLSFNDTTQALRNALSQQPGAKRYYWVRDCFDDYFVYEDDGSDGTGPNVLYKRSYVIADDGTVTMGDPVKVQQVTSYEVCEATDPNVGDGVDRSKIPAADFAGKNKSFPIVEPKDVADAAASIGRAGADNYSSDELKTRIIAIAKRKGAPYVARLPKAWQDSPKESADFEVGGDFIPLVEKAVRRDSTVPLKVIAPGWGSSGYYGAEMLERDGPKVFAKGTKMFWDHPTASEEAERPERSLRDLAAEFVSDARWDATGAAGPGLYADAKVFGGFKESIEELAPHIGVSIRALGKGREGQAEGKKGKVIESLVAAKSVDFVTVPGAGGQVCQLFESARSRATSHSPDGGSEVTEAEAQALREANTAAVTRLAQLEGRLLEADAREFVQAELGKIQLPEAARQRLTAVLVARAPVKDGALDREAFAVQVKEAAAAELAYIGQVAGSGAIRGMGASAAVEVTTEQAAKSMEGAFLRLGLSESAAKIAAGGRS